MNLRDHVAKAKLEGEVMPALIDELYDMYHNASLRSFPYDDEDAEEFWEWLSTESRYFLEDLQDELIGFIGYRSDDWELSQAGRSGATIAPRMLFYPRGSYMRPASRRLSTDEAYRFLEGIDGLSDCDFGDPDYDEPPEPGAYEDYLLTAEELLKAIAYINKTVAAAVAGIDESWDQYKEEVRDETSGCG